MQTFGQRIGAALRLPGSYLAAAIVCAAGFTIWAVIARGRLSLPVAGFFVLFALLSTYAGDVTISMCRLPGRMRSFSLAFVLGFFAIGIALFVFSLALPFGLMGDGLILCGLTFAFRMLAPPLVKQAGRAGRRGHVIEIAVVVMSVVAAGLWTQDCLRPMVRGSEQVLLKPWVDSEWEACQIRIFATSHGAKSLQDLRMAGQRPAIYHYGSFLVPALLNAATGCPDYFACTAFMIPAGLMLCGLAAYVLGSFLRGPWGGLAAAFGILALPDARYHGLGMPYFSYGWLQQIAPGGAYGTALLAVAWLLAFEACRKRRMGLLVFAWVLAGCVVSYKAQIAIAAVPLIWLLPPLLYRGLSRGARMLWLGGAAGVMALVLMVYSRMSVGPVFRLDFSGIRDQSYLLHFQFEFLPLRKPGLWMLARHSFIGSALGEMVVVVVGTFGVLLLLFPLAAILARRRIFRGWLFFPVIVAGSYVLLAIGLARDTHGQGAPDELLHRPFVWAYFVAIVWTFAIFGELAYRRLKSHRNAAAVTLALACLAAILIPASLGHRAQVGPDWGKAYSWQRVPRGLLDAAAFLRSAGTPSDLIQDSDNDPYFRLSTFAEKQAFAIDHPAGKNPAGLAERLAALKRFRGFASAEQVRQFADQNKLTWYVLAPSGAVAWPAEIVAHPVFVSQGYRVYKLR